MLTKRMRSEGIVVDIDVVVDMGVVNGRAVRSRIKEGGKKRIFIDNLIAPWPPSAPIRKWKIDCGHVRTIR